MTMISEHVSLPLVERLAAFPVFDTLDSAALGELAARGHSQFVPRKRLIAGEGQHQECLGVVLEGRISVNIGLRGLAGLARPCTLYVVTPGETFLEFAALDGAPNIGDVVALTDVRYALFLKRDVRAAMRRCPAFGDALTARGMDRARHSIRRLAGHLTFPVNVRVAQVLLPYAEGTGLQPADPLLQRMTQAQLAAMTGSAKEVFARTIGELETDGVLRRERGHIAFLDAEKLADLASAMTRR